MSTRMTIVVDEIPEVTHHGDGAIKVGGWEFDGRDFVPTAEDVAAFARAKAWFEEHPEFVVPEEIE